MRTKPESDGLSLFCEYSGYRSLSPTDTRKGSTALLNTCSTTQGVQTLQRWFFRPLASLDDINARHRSVEAFARPENRQSRDMFRQSLKRMKNVQQIYDRLSLGDPREWTCWGHLVDVST
jgi:DNA mismatch repair ATPase MutS